MAPPNTPRTAGALVQNTAFKPYLVPCTQTTTKAISATFSTSLRLLSSYSRYVNSCTTQLCFTMSFSLVARRAPRFVTSSLRTAPLQHVTTTAKFTRSSRHQSTMSSDQQIVFTKNAPAGKSDKHFNSDNALLTMPSAWPLRMSSYPSLIEPLLMKCAPKVSSHQDPQHDLLFRSDPSYS